LTRAVQVSPVRAFLAAPPKWSTRSRLAVDLRITKHPVGASVAQFPVSS